MINRLYILLILLEPKVFSVYHYIEKIIIEFDGQLGTSWLGEWGEMSIVVRSDVFM